MASRLRRENRRVTFAARILLPGSSVCAAVCGRRGALHIEASDLIKLSGSSRLVFSHSTCCQGTCRPDSAGNRIESASNGAQNAHTHLGRTDGRATSRSWGDENPSLYNNPPQNFRLGGDPANLCVMCVSAQQTCPAPIPSE